MKIALMAIGKVAWAPVAEIVDTYAARIGHYMPFEMLSLPDAKRARGMTQDQQKAAEGKLMLAAVRPGDYLMLLDERGRELIMEMWRRNDLIRFGRFEDDWGWKNVANPAAKTDRWRRLLPLSTGTMNTNTHWTQNPGYGVQ